MPLSFIESVLPRPLAFMNVVLFDKIEFCLRKIPTIFSAVILLLYLLAAYVGDTGVRVF